MEEVGSAAGWDGPPSGSPRLPSAHSRKPLAPAALNHHVATYKILRSLLSRSDESQIIFNTSAPPFVLSYCILITLTSLRRLISGIRSEESFSWGLGIVWCALELGQV